jgi:hypothetical protein
VIKPTNNNNQTNNKINKTTNKHKTQATEVTEEVEAGTPSTWLDQMKPCTTLKKITSQNWMKITLYTIL